MVFSQQYWITVIGLLLILVREILLDLLQQLELPSLDLVALVQLIGNPLQLAFDGEQVSCIY